MNDVKGVGTRLRALLAKFASRFPSRTYFGVNGPYLTKYTLFHGGKAGWKLYLNHVLRSDEDPDPHDHPWAWMVAWVLVGGYVEYREPDHAAPWTSRTRYPGLPYVMTRTTRSPNAQGGYTCACGTTGWRCNNGPDRGKIVPHKQKKTYGPAQVVHVTASEGAGHKRHGRRGLGGW